MSALTLGARLRVLLPVAELRLKAKQAANVTMIAVLFGID